MSGNEIKNRTVRDRTSRGELAIADEAERTGTTGIKFFRDLPGCGDAGPILIDMPNIENRISRYRQLLVRVGLARDCSALSKDETQFALPRC